PPRGPPGEMPTHMPKPANRAGNGTSPNRGGKATSSRTRPIRATSRTGERCPPARKPKQQTGITAAPAPVISDRTCLIRPKDADQGRPRQPRLRGGPATVAAAVDAVERAGRDGEIAERRVRLDFARRVLHCCLVQAQAGTRRTFHDPEQRGVREAPDLAAAAD